MGNRFRACTPWAKRRASAAEAFTAKDRWKAPSWAAASSPAAWPDNASESESPTRVAVSPSPRVAASLLSRLLNPQRNQNSLHIGRAHVHVRAHGGGVGTLVERLEQRHLGDGAVPGVRPWRLSQSSTAASLTRTETAIDVLRSAETSKTCSGPLFRAGVFRERGRR